MEVKAKIVALVTGNTPDAVLLQTGLLDANGNVFQHLNIPVSDADAQAFWAKRDKPFAWTLAEIPE